MKVNNSHKYTNQYANNRILVIGDTHFPWADKKLWKFLERILDTYTPDRVIHTGDLLDQYAFSAYPKVPDANGPSKEIAKARKDIIKLAKLFPKMEIMSSNHDDRLYKRGTQAGIPKECLVPYKDLIKAPPDWTWHKDLTLTVDKTREQIYFRHTASGSTLNVAKTMGMTTVLGHHHNRHGIQAIQTPRRLIYAVDAGCLISDNGAPFSYNKGNVVRPVRGCTLIINGTPVIVPYNAKGIL